MKKVLFLLLAITLFSCEKEFIYPSDQYPIPKKDTIERPTLDAWGEFVITDGKMYIINHESGERFVFSHFGDNKTTSSLRWGGSLFDIEEIEQNKTTYAFYRPKKNSIYGDFVLNGDSNLPFF